MTRPQLPTSESSFKDLVAYHDWLAFELERARVAAEAGWAEYDKKAAEMVKLTNRWGVAIRRYKELVPEAAPAQKKGFWARLFGAVFGGTDA